MEDKQWYVVNTFSGYENKVKENLMNRVQTMGMQEYIFNVLVPTEREINVSDTGEKKEVDKKLFPGYVLVEMIMTDDSWYIVRNTPNVTGFIGSSGQGAKPIPLSPHEVMLLLKNVDDETKREIVKFDYEVGDTVEVTGGAFEGSISKISSVDVENQKVELTVESLGREIPVMVEAIHVIKI